MAAEIYGITHRTVDEEVLDKALLVVQNKYKGHDWYAVMQTAIKYLRTNPVAVEYTDDGEYMVEVASESNPGMIWHASRHECGCRGNCSHGRCFHRAMTVLLPVIDLIERKRAAIRAEQALRQVARYPDGEGGWDLELWYGEHFLGYVADEDAAKVKFDAFRNALAKYERLHGSIL